MTEFALEVPDGGMLHGVRVGYRGRPAVVLLHAGVTDSRGWAEVLTALEADRLDLVAYDRRGFGRSPRTETAFTHVADLEAVIDELGGGPVVLVGNSRGGELALDLALTHPSRVAGLVLLAADVSGSVDGKRPFEWASDPASSAIRAGLQQLEPGEVEERVRLNLHLWLDGPDLPEGRVSGPVRALAAAMMRDIFTAGTTAADGRAEMDAWARLGEVQVPVLVAWGDFDVASDQRFYAATVQRLPMARRRVLEGVAHLPSLERPDLVAELVREVVQTIS